MTPWPTTTPRRWQREALPLALDAIRAKTPAVVSAVMGAGKSVLLAEICASGRGRVVVTVPTVALVDQLAGTLTARLGDEVGRYYTHAKESDRRVTVCCLPSLPQLVDTSGFEPPALWIADEAHKTECATVLDAHAKLRPRAAIAVTATPFLADERAALSLWDRVVYRYSAADAFADGVLVRPEIRHWQGGEVTVDEAAATMIRDCDGPGLANATSIDDADGFARALSAHGIPAASIHSRLTRADQCARIDALRHGRVKCIVHVNMLSEGIDLPWLRWLAMRRPVGSRVRFCQEIGRVLRASPGKDRAILLDLHDLFGAFGLTYEAALGEGMRATAATAKSAAEHEAALCIADGSLTIRAVEHWRRYLRLLVTDFLAAGAVEVKIAGGGWRKREASALQIDAARKAVAGLARNTATPIAHRKALCAIAENAELLNRGECSDLLTIGFCLRDRRRDRLPWPAVQEVDA